MIVAIDGPAASGKSTVARAVARALGARYIDTGAMYRAVAWAVLQRGVDPEDATAVAEVAHTTRLDMRQPPEAPFAPAAIRVDRTDVTQAIRSPEVNAIVSLVARVPGVRRVLVDQQRALAGDGPAVLEGRDIGTVVFPDADVKVFLTAAPDERIRRRTAELAEAGVADGAKAGRVLDRDRIDSSRADSPLAQAQDALVIDTTAISIDEVVSRVLETCGKRKTVGQTG